MASDDGFIAVIKAKLEHDLPKFPDFRQIIGKCSELGIVDGDCMSAKSSEEENEFHDGLTAKRETFMPLNTDISSASKVCDCTAKRETFMHRVSGRFSFGMVAALAVVAFGFWTTLDNDSGRISDKKTELSNLMELLATDSEYQLANDRLEDMIVSWLDAPAIAAMSDEE